ncbi:MAG: ATP-binding domain-containing protein, partial [Lachnospiraceae bacterium]|nr:ATP-binding domain-containing protein [Lachnospiraceae bacterium]
NLIKAVIEKTGYESYLEETYDESFEERMENVDELISKAEAFEEENDEADLTSFLADVALVADIDSVDENDDRVLLMTIHSAKGLEFESVYLTGMEDGVFPGYMTLTTGDSEDMEEERRLAYVGITRAKKELTLTHAKARMVRGQIEYYAVSRFVKEIPGELLDNKLPQSRRFDSYDDPVSFQPSVFDPRPKATLKKKVTRDEDKPFIAKGINSLNDLAGLSKGGAVNSAEKPDYEIGDRVKHIKFGVGTVEEMSKEPRDYKVKIMFDEAGPKIMYASFAKLKKV